MKLQIKNLTETLPQSLEQGKRTHRKRAENLRGKDYQIQQL